MSNFEKMASTSAHTRTGSNSSMFAQKRSDTANSFIGHKRPEGHKRAESISSSFGHKRPEHKHKRNGSGSFFGHRRSESASNYYPVHNRNESMYAMTGLYAEATGNKTVGLDFLPSNEGRLTHDTVIRCHSRNPSSGV